MNRLLSCCLAAAFFACCSDVVAVEYRFTNIADTATAAPIGLFEEFFVPAISGGTAAFRARYGELEGDPLEGIFVGSGGAVTTIATSGDADPSERVFTDFGEPAISDGNVAFRADGLEQSGNSRGIFVGSGGPITTIAKTGDAAPVGVFAPLGFLDPTIDGATVAFRGFYSQRSGIFTRSGGTLTTIVKAGDPAPSGTFGFTPFGDPAISGDTVVFAASYFDASPSRGVTAIFTSSGGPLRTVVSTRDLAPSGTFTSFSSPTISDDKVSFVAEFNNAAEAGVFMAIGEELRTIVTRGDLAPNGTFVDFGTPSVSDNTVAFLATFDEGFGIFTNESGPLNTVIRNGDVLFGSTVTSVHFGRLGLDPEGSGNLAFIYRLADGRSGVAIAMPVPEPTADSALLFVAGAFLMRRSRRISLALC